MASDADTVAWLLIRTAADLRISEGKVAQLSAGLQQRDAQITALEAQVAELTSTGEDGTDGPA